MEVITRQKTKLSVIVLFYHGTPWIDSCIASLENQSLSRNMYEIIMVDNGGSTPSVEKYAGKPNINVVRFSDNYGFAGGNNRALRYAGGDIVLLLNQDAVMRHNCLEELLCAFSRHPEAGIISASMLMVSSRNPVDKYAPPPRSVGLYRLTRLGYAVYNVLETDEDVIPVNFVSGAVLAFRKTIIKDVGGFLFDDKLGSYMEDLDLSLRLKKTPWKMYVHRKSVVYHYRDTAFSGKPSYMLGKFVHISGNRLLVYYNHLKAIDFFKKLPALLLGIPIKAARVDARKGFNPFRAMVATAFLPLVAVYFGLRVLAGLETAGQNQNTSQQFRMNKKKLGRCAGIAMGFLFLLAGLHYFRHQNRQEIYSAVQGVESQTFLILIALTLVSLLIGTLRFKGVLHRMGYPTGFLELFGITTACQFSSVMTPIGIGSLVIAPFLKERFKIPMGTTLLLTAVDRLLALYILAGFVLLGLLGYKIIQSLWCLAVWIIILLFFGWSFFQAVRISDNAIHRFGVPKYGGETLHHLGNDVFSQSIMSVSIIFRFAITIIQFLIIAGYQGYEPGWITGWMIISVGFLTGIISMIPMGLMSRDAAIIALSSQAGIPAADGLVIVLLLRVTTSVPMAILGIVCGL